MANRYIVINRPDQAVSYDEIAVSPIKAVHQGDIKINGDTQDYQFVLHSDPNALWDVYRAPEGFPEVGPDDIETVEDGCKFEITLKVPRLFS